MSQWHTGDEQRVIDADDLSKEYAGGTFVLSQELMAVIRKLCSTVKVEWQMLLIGSVGERGRVELTGYYIPKQRVTSSTVTNLDCITPEFVRERNIVATIHSHADMGVFYSSTDRDYTNLSMIERHMVVNNKMEFVAVSRCTLPNGAYTFLKAQVMYYQAEASEVKGVENIDVNSYVGGQTWDRFDSFNNDDKVYVKPKYKHALLNDEKFVPDYLRGGLYDY